MEVLTVGQKARIGGSQEKLYIAGKCVYSSNELYTNGTRRQKGDIYVVKGREHPVLYTSHLQIPLTSFHWIRNIFEGNSSTASEQKCTFKIRHGQKVDYCVVQLKDQSLEVKFDQLQRALVAGQIFALYDENANECLGAAPIPLINLC